MIVYSSGYGVLLTDEFGSPYRGFKELVNIIREMKREDYYAPEWVVSCPSAEDYQFILGFDLPITKNNDFKAADERFAKLLEELLEELPDNVKEILNGLQLPEPDMYQLAGDC